MNKFYIGLFIFVVYTISQIFTFYQLQGHLWSKWIKDNPLLMTILGLPIGYVVILASRQMVELWDGQTWPNRIIGFCLGVIVFSLMSLFKFCYSWYPIVLEIRGIYLYEIHEYPTK